MKIGEYTFSFLETIKLRKNESGEIAEFMPQSRYKNEKNIPLNSHGKGPFCEFRLQTRVNTGGIYIVVYEEKILYIGKCDNLSERFGPRGYGTIHPRNCYRGGQSTNCRINNLIYSLAKERKFLNLWFLNVSDKSKLSALEQHFISELKPAWNIQFMQ